MCLCVRGAVADVPVQLQRLQILVDYDDRGYLLQMFNTSRTDRLCSWRLFSATTTTYVHRVVC